MAFLNSEILDGKNLLIFHQICNDASHLSLFAHNKSLPSVLSLCTTLLQDHEHNNILFYCVPSNYQLKEDSYQQAPLRNSLQLVPNFGF